MVQLTGSYHLGCLDGPVGELLQISSLVAEILIPIRHPFRRQHRLCKLLQGRHNVDEVLHHPIGYRRINPLLQLVQFL